MGHRRGGSPSAPRHSGRPGVTAQGKALTRIKTITETLQTTLNEIASALTVFWVGVAIAFGTYVALMIGCIIGACTVVGTIPSLIILAALLLLWVRGTFARDAAGRGWRLGLGVSPA